MTYIELDTVVARALTIVGLSGDDEVVKNLAREWVWLSILDLPITNDHLKSTKIYPKNLIIKKPADYRRGLDIALYDVSDCLIPHNFHSGKSRIYPDTEQFSYDVVMNEGTDDEETVTYYVPVDLSEDKNAFYLGTTGSNVAYALVRYYSYPIGTDNLPMIPEEASMTCMYFVRYMHSLRKNENQSEIANNERLYKIESDRCRARMKSFEMSDEHRKAIAALMNRMMPNFNRSRV